MLGKSNSLHVQYDFILRDKKLRRTKKSASKCRISYKKRILRILKMVEICITKTCPCNKRRFFFSVKIENFVPDFFFIFCFNICTQNIACSCTLEPPCQGGSNEYPQSMFWNNNKRISIPLPTPVLPYKRRV